MGRRGDVVKEGNFEDARQRTQQHKDIKAQLVANNKKTKGCLFHSSEIARGWQEKRALGDLTRPSSAYLLSPESYPDID